MTQPTEKLIREAAEKRADWMVDCCCNPAHPFHGDRCWYHMNSDEQYIEAFEAGCEFILSSLPKPDAAENRCPCGGTILADTEDWPVPLCAKHYFELADPIRAKAEAEIAEYREALGQVICTPAHNHHEAWAVARAVLAKCPKE